MFPIKDFNSLNKEFKTVAVGIAVGMPFWYLSFYLFNKDFYTNADLILKVVASFCLSTAYIGSIVFVALIQKPKSWLEADALMTGVHVSFFCLCIALMMYYGIPSWFSKNEYSIFLSFAFVFGPFMLFFLNRNNKNR